MQIIKRKRQNKFQKKPFQNKFIKTKKKVKQQQV
jgi:hypothetical protein